MSNYFCALPVLSTVIVVHWVVLEVLKDVVAQGKHVAGSF